MKIIIIGGSETSIRLAKLLSDIEEITIIEKDEEKAKELSNTTEALIIHGDGTDISVLQDAEIEKADVILPLTGDDKTNLMISVIAKSEGAKKIIPTVNRPDNEDLFPKIGIDTYISVVGAKVSSIKQSLYVYGNTRVIGQIEQGEVQIIEVPITKESHLNGKQPDLKKEVVYGVYREGHFISGKDKEPLQEGDIFLLFVKTKDIQSIIKQINES
jgi:trk system potassium uptake protein TrkA